MADNIFSNFALPYNGDVAKIKKLLEERYGIQFKQKYSKKWDDLYNEAIKCCSFLLNDADFFNKSDVDVETLNYQKKHYLILNSYFNVQRTNALASKSISIGHLFDNEKYYINITTKKFIHNILADVFDIQRKGREHYQVSLFESKILKLFILTYKNSPYRNSHDIREEIKDIIVKIGKYKEAPTYPQNVESILEKFHMQINEYKKSLNNKILSLKMVEIYSQRVLSNKDDYVQEFLKFEECYQNCCINLNIYDPELNLKKAFLEPIIDIGNDATKTLNDYIQAIKKQFTVKIFNDTFKGEFLNKLIDNEYRLISGGVASTYTQINKTMYVTPKQLTNFFKDWSSRYSQLRHEEELFDFTFTERMMLDRLINHNTFSYICKLSDEDDTCQFVSEWIEELSYIARVPNVFSRNLYIDMIYKMYLNIKNTENTEVFESSLDRLKMRFEQEALAYIGPFSRTYSLYEKAKKEAYRFLKYLSSIYYPVLEACFFVIINIAFSSDTKYNLEQYIKANEKDYNNLLPVFSTLDSRNGKEMQTMAQLYNFIRGTTFNKKKMDEWRKEMDIDYLMTPFREEIIRNVILQKTNE